MGKKNIDIQINKKIERKKLELMGDKDFTAKVDKELEDLKTNEDIRNYIKNEAYKLSKLETK